MNPQKGKTSAAITGCPAAPQSWRQTQGCLRAPKITLPEECTTAPPVAASRGTPVLLGRHRECAALDASLAALRTGQSRALVLRGAMYGIRHALPVMIKQGGGAIVSTVSTSAWTGADRHVAYQVANAGLHGLARHTAMLGGKHGVRCNSVAAGVILTRAALANTTEEWRTEILASVQSPRLGIPEDIAAMVAFLFSDDAAYVNGQTIHVDGGADFD